MPKYHTVFDSPSAYFHEEDVYVQGSSPAILAACMQWIKERAEQLDTIYVSLTQFNNEALHEYFIELSQQGVFIHLITQPISGFSEEDIPELKNLVTGQAPHNAATSPYGLARPIFASHYKELYKNYRLHVFPHLNILSAKDYPSLSLSTNVFLLLYKSGGGAIGYSTSDMSVGNPVKENCFITVEEDWGLLKTTHRFFECLLQNAIPIKLFDFQRKYNDLILKPVEIAQDSKAFYTAPFLINSTAFAEKAIVDLVKKATKRICIHAPEISAYEYKVDGRFHEDYENEIIEHYGFLRPVLEVAAGGVSVQCLAKAWESEASKAFLSMAHYTDNILFKKHSKAQLSFMLIDDQLLTSNNVFTAEIFIYLNDVQIDKFDGSPEENYNGIYAKMGQYLLITDEKVVLKFEQLFNDKWDRGVEL